MGKIQDHHEWEREKIAMVHLAFALSLTLQQLSSADRAIILDRWYSLTPEILVGWTGKELGGILADNLLTMIALAAETGLVDESLLSVPNSYQLGFPDGIKPSVN